MILNLGAGEKRYPGATNVDITPGKRIDIVTDLSKTPWIWKDNSIDGIYMSHVLEHFNNAHDILKECYRVLKVGGFLKLKVPHASSIGGIGCLGHYRTFSGVTLKHHLDITTQVSSYVLGGMKFKTTKNEINWLQSNVRKEDIKDVPMIFVNLLFFLDKKIITPIINKNIRTFERFWWPLVGGASEVVWEGIKI